MSAYAHLPYRPCVGIMLLNQRGEVFVGQRIDSTAEAWQMPQGGIDAGEQPLDAALRELREETGVTEVSLVAQLDEWLHYDLPDDLIPKLWSGEFRGQKQLWFAFQLEADNAHINIETDEPEFNAWAWSSLERLPEMIVPFKRELYKQVVEKMTPLMHTPSS